MLKTKIVIGDAIRVTMKSGINFSGIVTSAFDNYSCVIDCIDSPFGSYLLAIQDIRSVYIYKSTSKKFYLTLIS